MDDAVTGPELETVVRRALRARDARKRARLFDPLEGEAADSELVSAILTAAGFGEPEEAAKTVTRARRAAKRNEQAALPDAAA